MINEEKLTDKELLEVATYSQRMKKFVLEIPPDRVIQMSRDYKAGGCFIQHIFPEDKNEHTLQVFAIIPTKQESDQYMVVAEDFGRMQ